MGRFEQWACYAEDMRYQVLATDYDGTIASQGTVDDETIAALERLRESGRQLVLVTGREIDDLLRVFHRPDLFDRIVAENGAVLYSPADRQTTNLGEPPPSTFVAALRERGITPLSVGHVIVSTWEPNEAAVLDEIRRLGVELHVVFNKGAVMILPSGSNKASGLTVALNELSLSCHNAVGVGDAENDHAFLAACECAVAVANALPMLRERADLVTERARGAGVAELIDRLIASDLAELEPALQRHWLDLGASTDGSRVRLPPHGVTVMVAGPSGSGKSMATTAWLEQLTTRDYQFCLIDPEGDYAAFEQAIALGDAHRVPSETEMLDVLRRPSDNAVICLLGVPLPDRPQLSQQLLASLATMRARTGRPHWLVLDEAHHLLPPSWTPGTAEVLSNSLLVTVHPEQVVRSALEQVDVLVALGTDPFAAVDAFADALQVPPPPRLGLSDNEALVWWPSQGELKAVRLVAPEGERRRHRRKYAQGTLGPDKSFYFRGPQGKLQLRAHNLAMFVQMAEGVDDETWLFHLRRGDYSAWVQDSIKDDAMAAEIAAIEQSPRLSAAESRIAVIEAITRRYTSPA
jgi:hydroxymethylpyrimidine pyrophosphatase-like HAD family hydrolase